MGIFRLVGIAGWLGIIFSGVEAIFCCKSNRFRNISITTCRAAKRRPGTDLEQSIERFGNFFTFLKIYCCDLIRIYVDLQPKLRQYFLVWVKMVMF